MAEGSKSNSVPSTKRLKRDTVHTQRSGSSMNSGTAATSVRPTMPDLLNFETRSGSSIKIVEKIGSNYSKLGPLLLCDDDNSVTSAIVDEHRQNAEAINQEFMTRWLQGRGKKPVAWSTLICVLRDIGLSELAQRIEENLVPCQMQNKIKALMEENDELKQKLENCKQQLHEKEEKLCQIQQFCKTFMAKLQNVVMEPDTFTSKVNGPGVQSATVNHQTHVIVELTDSTSEPCSTQQKVTAELEFVSEPTPTTTGTIPTSVATISPSRYKVSYTARSRGQYKLHVQLNDVETDGSPFTITVYPEPTELKECSQVRAINGVNQPYAIAFNSHGETIVTQRSVDQNLKTIVGVNIQDYGDTTVKMSDPKGIAIDNMDNIYVSSDHQLQKFTSSGELIKSIGRLGTEEGQFNVPHGVTLYNSQVYVCDRNNHRIQVFDLDLNFVRSIGSNGRGKGEFNAPKDVKFDADGKMYVAEIVNRRVQVLDSNGRFLKFLGEEREGELQGPSALHFVDKYVYVCDYQRNCILVYETSGKFVTSFGEYGKENGQFNGPRSITSSADGLIYVCDSNNDRIQIF